MLEKTIFNNLVTNEDYSRKVLPFLKEAYFQTRTDKAFFKIFSEYITQYNRVPGKTALLIESDKITTLTDDEIKQMKSDIEDACNHASDSDLQWLLDQTEKFCQDKAVYNSIMESISILDGKSKEDKGSIPKILSDALAVSFDNSVGHDFLDDFEHRYDFYHRTEIRVPFDLDYFNLITKGGIPNKTLNIALAGTGVGKSLFMCSCSAANLMAGKNVLYITCEMSEEKIAERIDANLLNETVDMLATLPKESYQKKVERVRSKTTGKLIIKEYPTASAGASHFRHLLSELKLKKNFVPDIIYIDYLNICISSRLKFGSNVNSYTYIKSIAEELRGLAVEFNVPIVSATQTTRSGYTNTDLGLEDTSESFGLPATADFMFALITSEELENLNQIMIKQLKNRYNDPNYHKKFVVGVDRSKMRLYNVEQSAQENIVDDTPVFDNSTTGSRLKLEDKKFSKSVFDEFK